VRSNAPGIVIVASGSAGTILVLAAAWSNRTERRPAFATEIGYRIPLIGGALLMFPRRTAMRAGSALHVGWSAPGVRAGVALGIAVACGRASTGPLCRHVLPKERSPRRGLGSVRTGAAPIYSGLLLSLLFTRWLRHPAWRRRLALLLPVLDEGRQEEAWLSQQLAKAPTRTTAGGYDAVAISSQGPLIQWSRCRGVHTGL